MQRMDRLRRSLRDSFRKKREAPESSKPHQWQADEESVRSGTCSFHVKYLGCVEVFESRGMQVCEEAMKVLRQSRRRPVKSVLFVSGDGLRVVEDDTKGLIVDQTIEKVSFCAPDRNHERGFSYICRDGTTRRWMCHGFLASKESGERLSHAVGCAFAACLERKQKREKEVGVTMSYDPKTSTFTRSGSFRVGSLTESNGQSGPYVEGGGVANVVRSASVVNTSAIERPHAPAKMLERQGSFRGFTQLANQSPFKRQLSLRLSDLPSNIQRTQNNVDILTNNNVVVPVDPLVPVAANASPTPPPRTQRNRLHSLPNNSLAGPGVIPEGSGIHLKGLMGSSAAKTSVTDNKDLVSELCQQVTQGLSLLAANHDDLKSGSSTTQFPTKFTNPWDDEVEIGPSSSGPPATANLFGSRLTNPTSATTAAASKVTTSTTSPPVIPKADQWAASLSNNAASQNQITKPVVVEKDSSDLTGGIANGGSNSSSRIATRVPSVAAGSQPSNISILPSSVSLSTAASNTNSAVSSSWTSPTASTAAPNAANSSISKIPTTVTSANTAPRIPPSPARPPLISAGSVIGPPPTSSNIARRGAPSRSHSLGADPFDADWAAPVARTGQAPTNPFVRQQTFQVSM